MLIVSIVFRGTLRGSSGEAQGESSREVQGSSQGTIAHSTALGDRSDQGTKATNRIDGMNDDA